GTSSELPGTRRHTPFGGPPFRAALEAVTTPRGGWFHLVRVFTTNLLLSLAGAPLTKQGERGVSSRASSGSPSGGTRAALGRAVACAFLARSGRVLGSRRRHPWPLECDALVPASGA